ncbi:MAG TPA: hypothetical protein VK427_01250 [Kofleriaceae bacterium]|nr:hypothetical protein [Kofleriaceae bacterium]
MKQERLCSPREFARSVATYLAGVAEAGLPLPADEDLISLFEATFFASLHEEEARRAEFNVAWESGARGCASVIAIASGVPVTPKNLTKLAPATRREATSIAVRRDDRGQLVAWALLEQGAATRQPFTIRVLGAGVLRIDYAGVARALYARGELYVLGGVRSPARVLAQTFPAWATDDAAAVDPRAAVVARIAARTLEHGHGGMLLLLPADQVAPVGVRVHYDIGAGGDVLVRRYHDVIRDIEEADRIDRLRSSRPRDVGGRVQVRDEAQIAFAEAIELVARLTAIDNAVLLDTDLRVRGFGAQVIEGDTPMMTFQHTDPYSDDVHVDDLSTFKGTRHPAGVLFCMRQPGAAAAIIISQDARLSLATKHPRGGVEVLGSYERAFGWI